jgi:hypothetical protein
MAAQNVALFKTTSLAFNAVQPSLPDGNDPAHTARRRACILMVLRGV